MKYPKPSEITAPDLFHTRRRMLKQMLAATAAVGGVSSAPSLSAAAAASEFSYQTASDYTLETKGYDALTPKEKALKYNNFYELGTDKGDPSFNENMYAHRPWQVAVEGEVHKPRVFDIDDLLALAPQQERVYRLRCVEAWSMVIPWIGYPLSHLIRAVEPTGNAKYMQFLTFNPEELYPHKMYKSIPWPYSEGLRMDEAMNDLALLTFGAYGEPLRTQSGAPVRIIVPWKYGFKSGKALVKIRFTEQQPHTSWNDLQPSEYGFYANVNPRVNHPRWSQASERVISDSFFATRRETDFLNGFADEVASLYTGMDLSQQF